MKMVTVRNSSSSPAMVRGLLLLEDETIEVAAGLVAKLQAEYPQLVVIGGGIATDASAESIVAAANAIDQADVRPVEPNEPVLDNSKPKAKAKEKKS